MLLNAIINQNFAIPKNTQDEITFNALGLLGSGRDTYIEAINFLLQGHLYLPSYYHQQNNVDAYNRQFNLYLVVFYDFKQALNGVNDRDGLIDKVIKVLKQVSELSFIKNDRNIILEFTANKTNTLKDIKSPNNNQ